METIAYLGNLLLAICGLPLAYRSWKNKHAEGVDSFFLLIWTLGEILTLIYVISLRELPLIMNYAFNLIFIGIVIYYKYFYKGD